MNSRFKALETIRSRRPIAPVERGKRPSDDFGANVFSPEVMKNYLPKDVYKQLMKTIEQGANLDRTIAAPVANGMKTWALEHGAMHFTHWFQPLTGLAAEKHDSFLELDGTEAIEKFSGEELSQQEPDASSFPNGGLRSTFEARGYTAWDCSSPAFIFDTPYGKTLCIPTVFIAYTGESLDFKAPLLKSIHTIDKAATAVAKFFDPNVKHVTCTLGAEQEYFLIDRAFHDLRPDIMLSGRALFGAKSARGQQLEDHYFGAIPERVFAFMNELEIDAHKLGIPLKTRHNEVAPGQFECAPRYEELSIAVDHGQMLMDLMERISKKHHFAVLLHEKPFAGVNGSGKHNNWSLATDGGKNLLAPGDSPQDNLMFLTFFVTTVRAIYEHADVLRASIATAGNDHRLGANEAPPAIISCFLGQQLSRVLDELENPPRKRKEDKGDPYLDLGISRIPAFLLDNTDRNRTSPFAFTGNKFELRAVGSSANSSGPMTVLNTIVAAQLIDFKAKVELKMKRGRKKESALLDVIREYIVESKAIRFEGDGYSDEWKEEAKRRGLNNVTTTPHALDFFLTEKSKKVFSDLGIFRPHEMDARYEVLVENYLKKVEIEADLIADIATTTIVPSAIRYQKDLLSVAEAADDVDMKKALVKPHLKIATKISELITDIMDNVEKMEEARTKVDALHHVADRAKAYADSVLPFFVAIRTAADGLEGLVGDEYWQLPKYREMLFVK